MSKQEQIQKFYEWVAVVSIPANYCRQTLEAFSMSNASDVEDARIFEVAKNTALQYLDDESWAIESGVAK